MCIEFASFYCDSAAFLDARRAWELFNRIEELVASDANDNNAVANALCTCFLEGIACTPAGSASLPFMGAATLDYFQQWHVVP